MPKNARIVLGTDEPALPACLIEPSVRRGVREIVVQRDVEAMLVRAGCVVTVTDAAVAFGHDGRPRKKVNAGWPDVTACGPLGRFIAFETKAGRNGLRPEQKRVLGQLWAAGAIVAVPRTLAFAAQVLYNAYYEAACQNKPEIRRLLAMVSAHL